MRPFCSLFVAFGIVLAAPAVAAADYDVVIRGGRVLDGAGNPWFAGDVAIKDGRFVRIGHVEGHGTKEIDARGLYVSPGWIDIMDQSGEALLENGLAENKVRMGVTTLIGGEGGTPVKTPEIPAYFSRLKRQGISVNFGSFYGLNQAREEVIGSSDRKPTPEELERMKALVDQAMRSGAMGVATALIYPPFSFMTTDEIIELARVAGRYNGVYATHMRDEGRFIEEALAEAISIGEKAGIRVEGYHLKVAHRSLWNTGMQKVSAMIDAARARGVDVAADVYPYTAGGTGLDVTAPNWIYSDGLDKAAERLRDPAIRTRIKAEMAQPGTRTWTNLLDATGGWDGIVLTNAYSKEYTPYEGKSIGEIARLLGRDPADTSWDIFLAGLPQRASALFFMMNEEDVKRAISFPWTSISTDGPSVDAKGKVQLTHPRAYGTFPRIIGKYVRDEGVISLPDAIRKMTSLPASRVGLNDRGVIRAGMRADVVVFDFDRIKDTATYANSAQYPEGIRAVLVNGALVVDGDRHTGARPGQVLLGPGTAK